MQRAHRKAHAWLWAVLPVAMLLLLVIAFVSAPTLSKDAPSLRLDSVPSQEHP